MARLLDNLLKLEHDAGFKKTEPFRLRKLAVANMALHLVLTTKSELNLNDKDVFPKVCIDVF